MLKIVPPTTNCGCGYFTTKCAEIHYQTSEFSILCIFCGMATESYANFVEHFNSEHFEDFAKDMRSTAEVTKIFEEKLVSKEKHDDPLEFGEKDLIADPDIIMRNLQNERLVQNSLKLKAHVSGVHEDNASDGLSKYEKLPFNKELAVKVNSLDEHLNCEIKVERSDLKSINSIKSPKAHKQHINTSIESESLTKKEEMETECTEAGVKLLVRTETECYRSKEEYSGDKSTTSISDTCAEEDGLTAGLDINWSQLNKPAVKSSEKRSYKLRNKTNMCTYCGRTFRRRYQLDTHLNIHTGSKPHQCEICGRQFRAVTTLLRHLNTHEQREAYTCRYCSKAFTHKAALISHELRHTQQRRVPCDECNKCFYTANQLDTHKRKVHHKTDETLPFACNLCNKRYRSASMLSTHKFKKHYKTAKFCCEQCGKKCINEQQLEAHKTIHIDGLRAADAND